MSDKIEQEEENELNNNEKESPINIENIEIIQNDTEENKECPDTNEVKYKEINEEETKDKDKEKDKEKEKDKDKVKEYDDIDTEQILSNTRVNITFSQMNESTMSRESVQTYQSLPFKEDKPDLDLPYFNPTKYESIYWKIFHSISYFLFAAILATSTWFYYKSIKNYYYLSLFVANFFFFVSTIMEWTHFKRGCIGYSNLNSKLKRNIDKSFRAKILRSEYGIKYFISIVGTVSLITGNIYSIIYFDSIMKEEDKNKLTVIKSNFIQLNLFGMLIIGLSQIMKLEKILIENKTNSIKNDFSNVLFEILLFFGSLFYGASYMIQFFYTHTNESPFDDFYLIIRIIGNIGFFASSLVLQYRYYLSNYKDMNIEEEYAEF